MKVTKIITVDVYKCTDCPHCSRSMDGVECDLLTSKYGAYEGFVFPEGRTSIHPKCPLK